MAGRHAANTLGSDSAVRGRLFYFLIFFSFFFPAHFAVGVMNSLAKSRCSAVHLLTFRCWVPAGRTFFSFYPAALLNYFMTRCFAMQRHFIPPPPTPPLPNTLHQSRFPSSTPMVLLFFFFPLLWPVLDITSEWNHQHSVKDSRAPPPPHPPKKNKIDLDGNDLIFLH